MDLSAFSHGQVHSKLWLCEELEKHITEPVRVVVLGCWYNVTGFLMYARRPEMYKRIDGVDINLENVAMADKINDAWKIDNKLNTFYADANNTFYQNYDVAICTSTEDIPGSHWFERIPEGKLICLQSLNLTSNQTKKYDNWNIVNPNKTFKEFKNKYPLSSILYEGSKKFDYDHLKYTRFMMIGIK